MRGKPVTFRAHGVTIKSGGTFQFPITVERGDAVLWRFSTRGGDIAFGVGVDDGAEVRTLVASERMGSDKATMTGEVIVDGAGVVVLVWDNSHAWSWSAAKLLTYAVEVTPNAANAASAAASPSRRTAAAAAASSSTSTAAPSPLRRSAVPSASASAAAASAAAAAAATTPPPTPTTLTVVDPAEVARQRRVLYEAKATLAQVDSQAAALRSQIASKRRGLASIVAEIDDLDRLVQSVTQKESKVEREALELRAQLRAALVKCFDSRVIAEVLLLVPEDAVRALRCTCMYYAYNIKPPLDCPGFRETVEW